MQSETKLDGSLKHWCNREEDEIYPLAETQRKDQELKVNFKKKCNTTKRGYKFSSY
jgi:hypothetical protein